MLPVFLEALNFRDRKMPKGRKRKFYPIVCSPVRSSSRVSSRQGGGRDQEAGTGILEA